MTKRDRRTPTRGPEHVVIECVTPELDAGRFPVKRVLGDVVAIGADVYKEGHDLLAARAVYRAPGDGGWEETPLVFDYDADRWSASIVLDRIGRWQFTVEAWTDVFGTWRAELAKKANAGQDVRLELIEGAQMIRAAARRAKDPAMRGTLLGAARMFEEGSEPMAEQVARATEAELRDLMQELHAPRDLTCYRHDLWIQVDRPAARFGAWYELFPRSQGPLPRAGEAPRHGTFADVEQRLPALAALGYDVLYLPPIHPIGHTFRKGKNNSLEPGPDDVGSPWAIGSEEGGHTAVHPALGTVDDFARLVRAANAHGMEIALDYALQCSPDHPWVREHPNWFHVRPDGSIRYAENPPKKYQDIYPLNFWCDDRVHLWAACRDIFLFWIARGVKIFRVDNPHTKPLAFWEWVIGEVQREHPDTIFFAEAFTRPKRMKYLAKLGFTMSYTYFTWKNTRWELVEYLEELTQGPMREYYRGNLFANTPDILNEYLVHGGPAAFRIRFLLAATLLPLYGLYSGYELYENVPVKPGSEEYLNSEKYEVRPRDWEAIGNMNPLIAQVNGLRRAYAALQRYDNLTFHAADNPQLLCYRKASRDDGSAAERDLFVVVTLDPRSPQEGMVEVPTAAMGIGDDERYEVRDLLTGARYEWRGARNYVRLDPAAGQVGHVFEITKLR